MNVSMLSRKLFSKRTMQVAIAVVVLAVVSTEGALESQAADGFWRTNTFRSGGYVSTPVRSQTRVPTPRTGYGANFHRNFVIRQQQQRTQSGGSLIPRGNVFWRR
jgi:hypothetical protein